MTRLLAVLPGNSGTGHPFHSTTAHQGTTQYGREAEHGMGIISWIILGLLAGAIAKFLLPGRDPGGLIGTTLIGVAGAFIGGWISSRWLDRPITKDFYDTATWVSAIGGALVLLIIYRIFFGDSRSRR